MRQVKLYTLNLQDVMVSGDYLTFSGGYGNVPISDSFDFIVDAPIEVKNIPVEKHTRIRHNVAEEYLVAFDPEIRKLINNGQDKLIDELQYTKNLYRDCLNANKTLAKLNTELQKENNDMRYEINDHEREVKQLSEGLEIFYNMPLWKRLIYLFVGKIEGE